MRLPTLLAALAALALPAGAQAPSVAFTRAPLRLDGALDEPAWAAADSITDFTQRDPAEGTPATERTVVRFAGTAYLVWNSAWPSDLDGGLSAVPWRRPAGGALVAKYVRYVRW